MITIDNVVYDVFSRLESLNRSFSFLEGENAGRALSGTEILDTIGTMYGYSLVIEPNLTNVSDYHALYEVLSSPDRVHDVTMPYGDSTISFRAKINSGSDVLNGRHKVWRHLNISITPIAPQRES